MTENAPLSISNTECFQSWNRSNVVPYPGQPGLPVHQIGLIGSRVWVDNCRLVFDLGNHRVFIADYGGSRFDGTGIDPDQTVTVGMPWNACQNLDGTIADSGCDSNAASDNSRFVNWMTGRAYDRYFNQADMQQMPTWWLGRTFAGIPGTPGAQPNVGDLATNDVSYNLDGSTGEWSVRVLTIGGAFHNRSLCDKAWAGIACYQGTQTPAARLVTMIYPKPNRTVVVLASLTPAESSARATDPLPPQLRSQILGALQPVPASVSPRFSG